MSIPLSLQPRSADSSVAGPPQQRDLVPRPRRGPVTRCACDPCRRKKTKCDGVRPICSTCVSTEGRQARCRYSVREGAVSLIDDLKRACAEAESERDGLRELVDYLSLGPEKSVWQAVQQLRAGADPRAVLENVARLRVPMPDPGAGGQQTAIEAEALAGSLITVPARPWTSVADDGIVSTLISAFFKWDEPFAYSYVVRDLFVSDMRGRAPSQAKYCSPLLVNALCAARSFQSDRVKQVQKASGIDLGQQFFAEAKKHLDAELLKPCLTTAQGLFTLYLCMFSEGTNGAGALYRFAAYEMLQRMKAECPVVKLDPSLHHEAQQREAMIRTAWGFYVFECFLSNTYQTPPILPPPTVPKPLGCGEASASNVDINGHPYGLLSPGPPMVPGVLGVLCDAALLYHRIMAHNSKVRLTRTGGAADMDARAEFFSELATLKSSLHPRMRYGTNPTPQTLYLQLYFSVIAYNLVRPLPATARIPYPPERSGFITASILIVQLCAADVRCMESYVRIWGLAEYSPMFFTGIWNVTTSLVPLLPDSSSSHDIASAPDSAGKVADLFTRVCAFVPILERDYPVVWPAMQGVLALARKTRKAVPQAARPYLEEGTGRWQHVRQRWDNFKDLPINLALPVQDRLLPGEGESEDGSWGMPGEEGTGGRVGCDLAGLLRDWIGDT